MLGNSGISGDFKGLPFLNYQIAKHEASAYTGGTPDSHGDHDGTADPYTIFTVTGLVHIRRMFGTCGTLIAGAGTIDLGITEDVNIFATQLADATTWDADEIWDLSNDPGTIANGSVIPAANDLGWILNGTDVIETLAAANLTSGQVDWYCIWAPLASGASIVSA